VEAKSHTYECGDVKDTEAADDHHRKRSPREPGHLAGAPYKGQWARAVVGAGYVRSKTVVIAKLHYHGPPAADAEYLPARPVLRSDIPGSQPHLRLRLKPDPRTKIRSSEL
jgi:hypothetical protein